MKPNPNKRIHSTSQQATGHIHLTPEIAELLSPVLAPLGYSTTDMLKDEMRQVRLNRVKNMTLCHDECGCDVYPQISLDAAVTLEGALKGVGIRFTPGLQKLVNEAKREEEPLPKAKPCPVCGGDPFVYGAQEGHGGTFFVRCEGDCGLEGPVTDTEKTPYLSRDSALRRAIYHWNRLGYDPGA